MTTIKKIIEAAFNASPARMLGLREFMLYTDININDEFADRYFNSLRSDMKIYISDDDIKYLEFNGEFLKQKARFLEVVKKNISEGEKYWIMDNREYKNYYLECGENINEILYPDIRQQNDKNKNQLSENITLQNMFDTEVLTLSDYKYPDPNNYIAVNGKGKQKHIIMTVRGFKEILMMINTEKAKQVRKYYIDLEELVKLYDTYNMYFMRNCISKLDALLIETKAAREEAREESKKANIEREKANIEREKANEKTDRILLDLQKSREDNQKILNNLQESREVTYQIQDELAEVSDRLNTSVVDRVPKTDNEALLEQFVILKLNDANSRYYVIRAQTRNITAAVNRIKVAYPNARRCLVIDYQPNSKNLFSRIKEKLCTEYITVEGNFISLQQGVSHNKFIKKVERLNEKKKDV